MGVKNMKFKNFDSLIEYMTKNNYLQNIINNVIIIANKHEMKNNVKNIILYDDMFTINFLHGALKLIVINSFVVIYSI